MVRCWRRAPTMLWKATHQDSEPGRARHDRRVSPLTGAPPSRICHWHLGGEDGAAACAQDYPAVGNQSHQKQDPMHAAAVRSSKSSVPPPEAGIEVVAAWTRQLPLSKWHQRSDHARSCQSTTMTETSHLEYSSAGFGGSLTHDWMTIDDGHRNSIHWKNKSCRGTKSKK